MDFCWDFLVIGPEGLMTRLMWLLQDKMPGKLAEFRVRYDIQDESLEDITRWLTTEPPDVAIDKPPLVAVIEQDSDSLFGPAQLTADGGGGAVYEFRYRVAVFAYARGVSYETTARTRQRYGLAVREILLQTPGIGDPDVGTIVIDPASIIETYSGISQADGSREIIAATALMVQYRCQEYLGPRLPTAGGTGTPTVGVGVIP